MFLPCSCRKQYQIRSNKCNQKIRASTVYLTPHWRTHTWQPSYMPSSQLNTYRPSTHPASPHVEHELKTIHPMRGAIVPLPKLASTNNAESCQHSGQRGTCRVRTKDDQIGHALCCRFNQRALGCHDAVGVALARWAQNLGSTVHQKTEVQRWRRPDNTRAGMDLFIRDHTHGELCVDVSL